MPNPKNKILRRGGSPGLVVIGRDSCSKGRVFKSWYRILDGNFSHIFVVKVVMFAWKGRKINEKEAGIGPFKKKFESKFTLLFPRRSLELFNKCSSVERQGTDISKWNYFIFSYRETIFKIQLPNLTLPLDLNNLHIILF